MAFVHELSEGTTVALATNPTERGIVMRLTVSLRGAIVRVRWLGPNFRETELDPTDLIVVPNARIVPEEFTTPNGLRLGMRVRHLHDAEIRGTVTWINQADGTLRVAFRVNGQAEQYRDRWTAFEVDNEWLNNAQVYHYTPPDDPEAMAEIRRLAEESVRNRQPGPLMPLPNTRTVVRNIEYSPALTAVLNALCMESPPPEIRLALAVLMGDLESAGPLADLVAEQRQVRGG
jgi:hypothetical protein